MEASPVLIVSTRNLHKVREIAGILGSEHRLLTLADLPASPKIVEDGDTFEANAKKKAAELAEWIAQAPERLPTGGKSSNVFVMADDSGLEVAALGGAPGVHSARFASTDAASSGNCSDEENNRKLLGMLDGLPISQRQASFQCVIAVSPMMLKGRLSSDGEIASRTLCFAGTCPGSILTMARGVTGFGYDPLFVPDGYDQTYAELGDYIKNGLSHRARALAKLRDWLAAGPLWT